MQKTTKEIKPEDIIEIFLRRRWWIIIPFCLTMIVGIGLAFMLPRMYKAETLVLIQPQKVPTDYVQPVVTTDTDARIEAISRQILSRSNLERIMQDFNLYTGPEYETMYMEDKIADLRENISVQLIRREIPGYRGITNAYAFTISFEGKDPEKVKNVTNALASYFIDANMRFREAEAIGTSNFLGEELNSIRKELAANEKKLKEYREKNMGELPEQLASNLGMLTRLEEQLKVKQTNLLAEKNKLAMIMEQITDGAFLFGQGAVVSSDGRLVSDFEKSISLEQAKEMLSYLQIRYTENHPDVIRIKKIISDLEQKHKKDNDTSGGSQYIPPNAKMEVERIKVNINTLTADISKLKSQIRVYEKRIENTPAREQELASLKRDYNNVKAAYDFLLNKKLESEVSVNMEKKQKGQKFQVLDPARLPEKPSFPNMKILFLLCLAAGPNIGLGLVFLLEYLNTSFRNPKDIESYLGVPVLATVPIIYDRKDKIIQRLNPVFSIFSIMFSCVLVSVFAVLSFYGVDKSMELLNRFLTTI
ncbi:MAG: protein GumC [Deltaproteobacteria bacterium]|nr:protein GumC [Deltaproteobacteria bacterium]MBW2090400.1 protein GumC [Deltaproteobacteria bacterium]